MAGRAAEIRALTDFSKERALWLRAFNALGRPLERLAARRGAPARGGAPAHRARRLRAGGLPRALPGVRACTRARGAAHADGAPPRAARRLRAAVQPPEDRRGAAPLSPAA